MNCPRMKQLQLRRVLFFLSGLFLCTLYSTLTISGRLYEPLPMPQVGKDPDGSEGVKGVTLETGRLNEPFTVTHDRELTVQTTSEMHVVNHMDTSDPKASTTTESPLFQTTNCTTVNCSYVDPEETPTRVQSKFPADVFSIEDRRRGWVILHIIGMIYMIVSLTIVCDEFFVPALGVITDKLEISDDVTGATFMAAGRSIPKFFAILIGNLSTPSVVGIATITSSAVFNILFVIGMCALFSWEGLHLTWWPFFRDVSFYIFDLILLIIFSLDNVIYWWESVMLVVAYSLYVIFMKFNVQIERAFKTQLHKHKSIVKVMAIEEPEKEVVPAGENESKSDTDQDDSSEHHKDSTKSEDDENKVKEEEVKGDKPFSLHWPDTRRKQATYLFLFPIVFPVWLTVPDVRNQKSRKFFVVTFLGSILWMAVFSYLIAWWAYQVGETFGVSHRILTILAAETSLPDLISSVIVAHKGLGDMAVSSSVGSNIFDITVGFPLSWILHSFIYDLAPVYVIRSCVSILLFLMLLFLIISFACCKCKVNKVLGFSMCLLYLIFLVSNIMLHCHIIVCPV